MNPLYRAMEAEQSEARSLVVNVSVTVRPDRSGSIEYRPYSPSTRFPSQTLPFQELSDIPPIFKMLWGSWDRAKPGQKVPPWDSSRGLTAEYVAAATTTPKDIEDRLRRDLRVIEEMHPKSKFAKYKQEIIDLMSQISAVKHEFHSDNSAERSSPIGAKEFDQELEKINAQRSEVINAVRQLAGTTKRGRSTRIWYRRLPGSFDTGKRR